MRKVLLVSFIVFGLVGCATSRYDSAETWMMMRPAGAPKPKALNVIVTAKEIKDPGPIRLKQNQEWIVWKFPNVPPEQTPRIEYKNPTPFDVPVCYLDEKNHWFCESTTYHVACSAPNQPYEIDYAIHIDGSGIPPLDPKIIVDP